MPSVANGTGSILAQGFVTTGAAAVYGPVEGQNAQVELRGVVFSNESASATTVTYGVGKSGAAVGAAGTSSGMLVNLGARGTPTAIADASELEYMVLGSGDYLWASAVAGSAVAATVNGVVY